MADWQVITQIAEGLLEVAKERDNVAVYREDLKFFDWVTKHNKDLVSFLDSPLTPYKEKSAVIDSMFKDLLVPDVLVFIKMLMRDSLISDFSDIRAEYNKLSDEKANIAEGIVYTPYKLDNTTIRNLERAFREKINKNVILKQSEDKNLVAGIKVVLDGTSYELSVGSKLETIKENLKEKI